MSGTRAIVWLIEPDGKETYVVKKRNRVVRDDLSIQQAMKYVRNGRESGDPVHQVAEDGYVSNITNRFQQSRTANPRRIRFGFSPFRHGS